MRTDYHLWSCTHDPCKAPIELLQHFDILVHYLIMASIQPGIPMYYKNIIMLLIVVSTTSAYGMQKSPTTPDIHVLLQLTNANQQLITLSIPPEIWEYITTLSDCRQKLKRLSKFFSAFYATYNSVTQSSAPALVANTRTMVTAVNNLPAYQFPQNGNAAMTIISYHHNETNATRMINQVTTTQGTVSNANDTVSIPAQLITLCNSPAHKEHLPNSSTPSDSLNYVELYNAWFRGHIARVITALNNGQTLSDPDLCFDPTPVHIAARYGQASLIQAMASRGIPIDTPDRVGNTPLTYAAKRGHFEAVVTLITLGANVNIRQSTPLYEAVKENHLPIVEYLVNNGANLAHIQDFGDTLLHTATSVYVDSSVLTYLLSKNIIPINHTNQSNETPLTLACRRGLYQSAETLIAHGADVNFGKLINYHGIQKVELPFDIAYDNKNFDIVKLLHSHKARHTIEIQPSDMLTAIMQENLEYIKALLALNIKVTTGMIEAALGTKKEALINLLLHAKAQD